MLPIAQILGLPPARADQNVISPECARAALKAGQIKPMTSLLALIQSRYWGEVIEAELRDESGGWVYEFELLSTVSMIMSGTASRMTNNALFNNSGFIFMGLGNDSPTLTNQSGATIVNRATGAIRNLDTFINDSVISNDGAVTNEASTASFIVTANGLMFGSGSFNQSAGVSVVDGVLSQGAITITGGTLKGTGVWNAPVITIGPGATVSPGHSPGTLTMMGEVDFSGILDIEVASPTSFDILKVIGAMKLMPGARIDLTFDAPLSGTNLLFDFLQVTGTIDGFDPAMIFASGGYGDYAAMWNEICSNGVCDLRLALTLNQTQPVPEPGMLALLLPAMGGLGAINWRRRRLDVPPDLLY